MTLITCGRAAVVCVCATLCVDVCIGQSQFREVKHGSVEVEGIADNLVSNSFVSSSLRYSGIPAEAVPAELFFRVRIDGKYYNCTIPQKRGKDLRAGDAVRVSGTLIEVRERGTDHFHNFRLDRCQLKARRATSQS